MKFRGTLGGLNIQLGTDDTPQSVTQPLQTRRALLASGVILEIDVETSLATLDAVRGAVEQAGGHIVRLRAPRVPAPPPRRRLPTEDSDGNSEGSGEQNIQYEEAGHDTAEQSAAPASASEDASTESPALPSTALPHTELPAEALDVEPRRPEPVVLAGGIRAGFRGEYAGSVVVLGDVNPGSELVAGGDIIVLGSLRGVVHAGADGREDAIVWARPIASTQIRIAGAVARAPQGNSLGSMKKLGNTPEVARLKEGQIVIERSNTPPIGSR